MGLLKNNEKNFLYIGDPNSLNYVTKNNKISILESLDINQKVKNVKIYKYVFN